MKYDLSAFFRLVGATLFPVCLSVGLYLLERNTKFGKMRDALRQVIVGVLFGRVAVLATVFGIPVEGAVLNVRNAAPLTAGLLFGGPAGLIVGGIGGIYRWVAIGGTTEVLHMLLVFITNMGDGYGAYRVVAICAVPMILCNAISVMLSLHLVARIGKDRAPKTPKNRQISQIFQFLLLICVVIAFGATTVFTGSLQTRIAYANADHLLRLNLDDVEKDIQAASDENLLKIARLVAAKVTSGSTQAELLPLLSEYDIAGINLVGANGVITESTHPDFIGYDMASGTQYAAFLCLLHGTAEYVQRYQPLSADDAISRKYAGIALPDGGFVQVGYDAAQFQRSLAEEIRGTVVNRHIGREGGIIVCDAQGTIVYDTGGHTGASPFTRSGIPRR